MSAVLTNISIKRALYSVVAIVTNDRLTCNFEKVRRNVMKDHVYMHVIFAMLPFVQSSPKRIHFSYF